MATEENKHIHFNVVNNSSNATASTGFLPTINPSSNKSTVTKKGGFLNRYNQESSKSTGINLAHPTTGFSGTDYTSTINTKSTRSDKSNNPYASCFNALPSDLRNCPALNFQDICDNCCSPQKLICSEDPNCHMFKDCRQRQYSYGETCKYLRGRGPKIPSWLAHCGRVFK